jgi:hypothetical protein
MRCDIKDTLKTYQLCPGRGTGRYIYCTPGPYSWRPAWCSPHQVTYKLLQECEASSRYGSLRCCSGLHRHSANRMRQARSSAGSAAEKPTFGPDHPPIIHRQAPPPHPCRTARVDARREDGKCDHKLWGWGSLPGPLQQIHNSLWRLMAGPGTSKCERYFTGASLQIIDHDLSVSIDSCCHAGCGIGTVPSNGHSERERVERRVPSSWHSNSAGWSVPRSLFFADDCSCIPFYPIGQVFRGQGRASAGEEKTQPSR